jgi:hypothetical protein
MCYDSYLRGKIKSKIIKTSDGPRYPSGYGDGLETTRR